MALVMRVHLLSPAVPPAAGSSMDPVVSCTINMSSTPTLALDAWLAHAVVVSTGVTPVTGVPPCPDPTVSVPFVEIPTPPDDPFPATPTRRSRG